MKKKMSKILINLSLIAVMLCSTSIKAATYDYGSSVLASGARISAYTYASNDYCSVTSKGTALLSNAETTRTYTYSASQDAATKYATINQSKPSGTLYFTKIVSTHVVGSNTYTSSDYR